MAMVTGSWLLDILILVATLLYLLHWYISRSYSYFKERGIPYLKPVPFLGCSGLFTKDYEGRVDSLYNHFPNEKYFGYFQINTPVILVKDADLIHRLLIKDFSHFQDRGFHSSEHDPLSKNLFNLSGHSWRIMRQKLAPTFTTGKLKHMFDQIVKCGDNLMKDIEKMSLSRETVDAPLIVFNFSTEVIGSAAFGLDFTKNNPHAVEFHKKVGKMFKMSFFLLIKYMVMMASPKLVSILKLKILPHETNEYFIKLAKATKEYRIQKNEKRNDYFQLLLTLQQAEETGISVIPTADISDEDALINQLEYVPQLQQATTQSKFFTDEGLAAQSLVFLTAGTESVSSVLRFTLYYVAKNPQIQERLKNEVRAALAKHGDWEFEAIRDMTYLDSVIQETQRLHPGCGLLIRECTIPYTLPNSNADIEKGTLISIPVLSIQRDPKYYPNPEVFNPDRFENNNHKPSPTFIPFGDGPRICIGMRFAILEMKVCLAKIFAQYSVELNSKTKESATFVGNSCFQKPVGSIWIDFKKDFQKVP